MRGDEFEFWNLRPDTVYIFSVFLERTGLGGRGEQGPSLRVTTLCAPPKQGTITNVKITAPAYHKLLVQWKVHFSFLLLFYIF